MISPPPAKRFRPAVKVRSAKLLEEKPAFITRGVSRGRFAVGVKYEREVQEFLSLYTLGRPEIKYLNGPWFQFEDKSGLRWCQPDALLVDSAARRCLIIEVKYQHTSDAWYQLKQLYLPVVRQYLQGGQISLLEMVHWYDGMVAWPERALNVPDLDRAWTNGEAVATLIFNRRRERRIHEARHSGGQDNGDPARPIWPAQGAE